MFARGKHLQKKKSAGGEWATTSVAILVAAPKKVQSLFSIWTRLRGGINV
jgi:hypothetical protein